MFFLVLHDQNEAIKNYKVPIRYEHIGAAKSILE